MTDSEIVVRPAADAELDALSDLTVRGFSEYRSWVPEAAWPEYRDDLADVRGRARVAQTLVAAVGDELVGVAALFPPSDGAQKWWGPNAPYIRAVAVDPAWRRRGVGRILVEACIADARARGHAAIGLMTHHLMAGARALYDSMGFAVIAERDDFTYGHFLVYRKNLREGR